MSTIKAVLFDMDGVIASVGHSYRIAIIHTAKRFNVEVSLDEIAVEKKKGNSNNDWVLTKRFIEQKRADFSVTLEEVTTVFEEIYQGTASTPGLCESEQMIPSRGFLAEIKRRCNGNVAIVTGRPLKDCQKFLVTNGIADLFDVCICMEHGPPKPSPIPVKLACEKLGLDPSVCLMIGDTPDDIKSAVAAGAIGWGVYTPEEDALITLGKSATTDGMYESLMASGAVGVMRAGMSAMLDLLDPVATPSTATRLNSVGSILYFSYNLLTYTSDTYAYICLHSYLESV